MIGGPKKVHYITECFMCRFCNRNTTECEFDKHKGIVMPIPDIWTIPHWCRLEDAPNEKEQYLDRT